MPEGGLPEGSRTIRGQLLELALDVRLGGRALSREALMRMPLDFKVQVLRTIREALGLPVQLSI